MKNRNLIDEYNKVSSPEELLEFMSKYIEYGYLGKDNKIYDFNDVDFDKSWYREYVLQTKDDILKTRVGNCFDQTEFERTWFLKHNYEIKTIFVMVSLEYENNYPTHSFLVYKDSDEWNWFESADYNNRGIHREANFNELMLYYLRKYIDCLRSFDISDEELYSIIIKEFDMPKNGSGAEEYLEWVINYGRDIDVKELLMQLEVRK